MHVILLFAAAVALHGDVIDQLMKLPAPIRDWKQAIGYVEPTQDGPPADAPLDMLVDYWAMNGGTGGKLPPAAVRERLVDAIERRPEMVNSIVNLLPVRDDVCARLRKAVQSLPKIPEGIGTWLLHHDPAARPELVKHVVAAHDHAGGGWVDGGEEMAALAQSDWATAQPLLSALAGAHDPRTRAEALALLFAREEGMQRDGTREALRAMVTDSATPAQARDIALTALLKDDWNGRDLWLVTLFRDPAFNDATDDPITFSLSSEVVASDPERWIPIMTSLLGSSNPVVRTAAVNALAQFNLKDARADALRPIICWLSDPAWAEDKSMGRLRLAQSVASLGLREAIPHLVWVVDHDEDTSMAAYAAEALGEFHDASGNSAMRRLLRRTNDAMDVKLTVTALVMTGGFSSDELADDIIAAASMKGAEAFNPLELHGSKEQNIGSIALGMIRMDDAVTRALIDRYGRTADSRTLEVILSTDTPSAAKFLVSHMADDDALFLGAAILHHQSLREHAGEELRRTAARKGIAGAVAAVIESDAHSVAIRLANGTEDEKRAVLAAARAARMPLDAGVVAGLYGRSPSLDRAVDAYLFANDEPPARNAFYAHHHGEARILGSRGEWDPGDGNTFGGLSVWEADWQKRILAGEADEVIGLAAGSTWAKPRAGVEIVCQRGKCSAFNGGQPLATSAGAIAQLRSFLHDSDFDHLPALITPVFDGVQYEYLHLTRDGGACVFMNNPGVADYGTPYAEVIRRFDALTPAN
jgi:hypothetical protein